MHILGAPEECGDGVPWTAGVRAVVVRVEELIKTSKEGRAEFIYSLNTWGTRGSIMHLLDAGPQEEGLWCSVGLKKGGKRKL